MFRCYLPYHLLFQHDGTQPIFKWFFKRPPTIWKILFGYTEYPNTIVDFEENSEDENGQYDWVIEMQCKDGKSFFGYDEIKFVGINFNSRIKNPSEEFYQNMINRA